MSDREQPSHTINHRPEVVAIALVGRPGMDRRAHANSADRRKVFSSQGPLRGQHRINGILGPPKCRAKCVADRLENVPVVLDDGRPHECVMAPDGSLHCCSVTIPTLRAAFNVGERKRNCAAWDAPAGDGRRIRKDAHALCFSACARQPAPQRSRIRHFAARRSFGMLRSSR